MTLLRDLFVRSFRRAHRAFGAHRARRAWSNLAAFAGEVGGMSTTSVQRGERSRTGAAQLRSAPLSSARLDRAEAIEFRQELPGTPDEVFPFFADARNLERITPPWLRFKVLSAGTIEMAAGARIDYRLSWRGIPLRWRTLISTWEPPFRFVDEQIKGPYRVWHHEHTFEASGDGTTMRDRIHFLAPLARVSHPMIVRRDVERIFEYRRTAILPALDEFLGRARASACGQGIG